MQTDPKVEAVARAICVGNPNDCVMGSGGTGLPMVCHTYRWQTYVSQAQAAIRAYEAARGGVAVRQLEWSEPRQTEDGDNAQDAYTRIGHYIASDDGWFLVAQSGWNPIGSIDEAKAAAQADFDARVRACLTDAPTTVAEG